VTVNNRYSFIVSPPAADRSKINAALALCRK